MPKIKFDRPVAVRVDGKRYDYPAGTHDVPTAVRDHQFIKHWIAAGFAVEVNASAAANAVGAEAAPATAQETKAPTAKTTAKTTTKKAATAKKETAAPATAQENGSTDTPAAEAPKEGPE